MTAARSDDQVAGHAHFARVAALIGRLRRSRPVPAGSEEPPAAGDTPAADGSALARIATRPVTRVAAAAVLGAAVLAPTAGDGVLRVATGAHHHPAHALPVSPTDPGTDPGQDPGGPDTLLPPYTPPYSGPDGTDQTPLTDSPDTNSSASTPDGSDSDQTSNNHNSSNPPSGGPTDPGPPAPVPATWGFARVRWVDDAVGATRDLAPSSTHPGNEESGWTYGAWSLDQTAPAPATVSHLATGRREVVLPSIGTPGGIVQAGVLDLAATGGTCQPVEWAPRGVNEAAEVDCFDAAGKPADLPFDLLFLAGDAGVGQSAAGQEGFVYAVQSTTTTYTPGKPSERNAGAVTRTGAGLYTVVLGPGAESVQLSVVGSQARYCALTGLTGAGATVSCRAPDGKPADTPFTLSYTGRHSLLDDVRTPDAAFLSVHTAAGTPTLSTSWLSKAGTATVERTAAGRYTLHVPLGFPPSYTHVTDRGAAHCTLATADDVTARDAAVFSVACFDTAGQPADADFDLAYATAAR